MVQKTTLNIFALFAVFVVLSTLTVSAFSLGSLSAVNVEPGQTKDTSISVLNKGADAKAVTVEATIDEGAEYVSFTGGSTFDVPAGEVASAGISVTVPASASAGISYPVKITFRNVAGGATETGTVEIAAGHSKSFNVNVVDSIPTEASVTQTEEPATIEPSSSNKGLWVMVIVVLLIIVIVVIVLRKRRAAVEMPMTTTSPPTA